jgi:phosphate transport system substrate-binding protein
MKNSAVQKRHATQLAWDAIVAIVHKDNPVSDLTGEQLTKIFKGEYTLWGDVITD